MTREELTYKHLSNLSDNIKKRLPSNTGNAADSLEVKGNQLLGNDYIYFLDKGRAPGKFPPVEDLRVWVRSKLGVEDKEAKGVAFLVGRKISRQGTDIYMDKSKGIQLDALVDDMLEELIKELPETETAEVLKWL